MVSCFAAYDDGSGPALFAGGQFDGASGIHANNIALWRSSAWQPLGSRHGLNVAATAMAVFDDGTGPALYVGGSFTTAGAHSANYIARWDGVDWSPLGSGLSGPIFFSTMVSALCVFDDGTGKALYAGGSFSGAGGLPVTGIAKWDGTSWSSLGSGLASSTFYAYVNGMAVYDDGTGAALYVGGSFDSAGGQPASHIAKWNGSTWAPVGGGLIGWPTIEPMCVHDDGSGPALYVGGVGATVGGTPLHGLARWNGSSWSDVGGGLAGGDVYGLAVYDDGSGPSLFAAGAFTSAGGTPANCVAKWNGAQWSAIGGGMSAQVFPKVRALAVIDDGSAPILCAAGHFVTAGGVTVNSVAKWNGVQWSPMNGGLTGGDDFVFGETVRALCVFGGGPDGNANLYAAGVFTAAGGQASLDLAEWAGCGHPGARICAGDGSAAACPCENSGANGHGCQNSALTGGSLLDSAGWPSVAFDALHISASGELASSLSIFLQGDAEIAPLAFGDGLRCTGGHLKRLFTKNASAGTVAAPQAGDAPIAARSAALGDVIHSGEFRVYQVYYRDPNLAFCPQPSGNSWNVSNAIRISWMP
jgi:hypothetical protein